MVTGFSIVKQHYLVINCVDVWFLFLLLLLKVIDNYNIIFRKKEKSIHLNFSLNLGCYKKKKKKKKYQPRCNIYGRVNFWHLFLF